MKRFATAFAGLMLLAVIFTTTHADITIEVVPVGNPGNPGEQSRLHKNDYTYYGGVDYVYNIGKYEVTAGQYCKFLNAVAKSDPFGLYNPSMDNYSHGCQITRNGTSGCYYYGFPGGNESDWANRPVNYTDWGDAARFANWLHNGQGNGDTESGAYDLSGTHPYYNPDGTINDAAGLTAALLAVTRNADWKWAIPTGDEWYKAAYHKNDGVTGNYFDWPTSSDTQPSRNYADPDPGNNATFWYYGHAYRIASEVVRQTHTVLQA